MKQNVWGGSAAGGGMNFQACVTAIAAVHVARGTPLRWLTSVVEDIPISISAETGGPGDDIRLELKDGSIAEIQVKKGLKAGKKLWESLLGLAAAIDSGAISYGVLVVCPESSGTIRNDLARDLKRIGGARYDDLKPLGEKLRVDLIENSLGVDTVCAR